MRFSAWFHTSWYIFLVHLKPINNEIIIIMRLLKKTCKFVRLENALYSYDIECVHLNI